MTHGYTPDVAYEVTWPEYLTLIVSQLPEQPAIDEVDDVKARMAKVRAEKRGS